MGRATRAAGTLLLIGGLAAFAGWSWLGRGDDRPPNVLIIVTDDQRGGLEVMPRTRAWLGAGGTRYTDAYVTTPLCCPSRASILTGRYAHNTGVTRLNPFSLDHETTIEFLLRRAGYTTAIFGKFLNGWPLTDDPPHFDRWAIFEKADESYSGGSWNVQGVVRTVDRYATRFIGDQAETFLESNAADPWFLYVAPPNPHYPFTPEPAYEDAPVSPWEGNPAVFETDRRDKPAYVRASHWKLAGGQWARQGQLRALMSVDDMVDRLLRRLEETGQLEHTVVFFISDNGLMWGEHGLGGKGVPYEQSINVPFFTRWPERFAAGATDERLVANIDIAPTVLDAAGIAAPDAPPMDGRSLLSGHERDRLLIESWRGRESAAPTWASLVTRTGQYIEYYGPDDSVSDREFYDRAADPWQLQSSETPPESLASQLADDRRCIGRQCP